MLPNNSVGSLAPSLGIGSLGVGSLGYGSLGIKPPTFIPTIANITGNNGVAITEVIIATNFTDVHVYSLQNAPSWMIVSNGVISGTPDAVATTNLVTVTGTNTYDNVVSNTFDVIIGA